MGSELKRDDPDKGGRKDGAPETAGRRGGLAFGGKLLVMFAIAGFAAWADLHTKEIAFDALLTKAKIEYIEKDFTPEKAFQVCYFARPIEVFSSWFHFKPGYNTGAVFGLGSEMPWLIYVSTLVALGCVGYFVYQCRAKGLWYFSPLGLILGGAVGNLADRFRIGAVRDFIDWFVVIDGEKHPWPTFNVADAFICVGVGLLIILFWRDDRAQARAAAEKPEPKK